MGLLGWIFVPLYDKGVNILELDKCVITTDLFNHFDIFCFVKFRIQNTKKKLKGVSR